VSVLDASAVIAWLKRAPGHDQVQQALDTAQAWISSVNLAEVLTHLHVHGLDAAQAERDLRVAGLRTVPYEGEQVLMTAMQAGGLSLGERACFALARVRGEQVLSANPVWLDLGVEVRVVGAQD